MAQDEYYDAIGEVLSFILSANDIIHKQITNSPGVRFQIKRDNTNLWLFAPANKRYFQLTYSFSISELLKSKYDEGDLLRKHMDEYDVSDSLMSDEDLLDIVAYHRLDDVPVEKATEVISDLSAHSIHSVCRFRNRTLSPPEQIGEDEPNLWDGVDVIGLLYPYEDDFGPRNYEEVAQNVISLGGVVDNQMTDLEVVDEVDFEPISDIR
jgi:hypothetical protein